MKSKHKEISELLYIMDEIGLLKNPPIRYISRSVYTQKIAQFSLKNFFIIIISLVEV